uniref:Uncharacterized protein n=1 Tax=Anguilla anguilla TaxID=7936 RepID=A0A0E9XE57_ANGAN
MVTSPKRSVHPVVCTNYIYIFFVGPKKKLFKNKRNKNKYEGNYYEKGMLIKSI